MTITELRSERNSRLQASDYAMLVDIYGALAEGEQAILLQYRQDLRDLPARYEEEGVIDDVDWPEIPQLIA